MRLDLGDGSPEIREIAFGRRRQGLHEGDAAKMGRKLGGEGRQRLERRQLFGTVQTMPGRIENEEYTPVLRYGQSRDDGSGGVSFRSSAVECDAPLDEVAEAEPRSRAA